MGEWSKCSFTQYLNTCSDRDCVTYWGSSFNLWVAVMITKSFLVSPAEISYTWYYWCHLTHWHYTETIGWLILHPSPTLLPFTVCQTGRKTKYYLFRVSIAAMGCQQNPVMANETCESLHEGYGRAIFILSPLFLP